ncbi:hypothetical protein ACJRO7_012983 [Eucalyptus globulus]|uniref:Uncharacterized protein n=1 Tax=Eucalyptus globulus TaxID=34317 RepID=A0ABD3LNT1_EUCGL
MQRTKRRPREVLIVARGEKATCNCGACSKVHKHISCGRLTHSVLGQAPLQSPQHWRNVFEIDRALDVRVSDPAEQPPSLPLHLPIPPGSLALTRARGVKSWPRT